MMISAATSESPRVSIFKATPSMLKTTGTDVTKGRRGEASHGDHTESNQQGNHMSSDISANVCDADKKVTAVHIMAISMGTVLTVA